MNDIRVLALEINQIEADINAVGPTRVSPELYDRWCDAIDRAKDAAYSMTVAELDAFIDVMVECNARAACISIRNTKVEGW